MGSREPIINGSVAEKAIAKEITKSWYKKPEAWFSLIAATAAIATLVLTWLK